MKRIAVVGALVMAFFAGACSPISEVVAEQTRPLKIWFENENGDYETYKVVDEKTGVNYVVASCHRGASTPTAIAITPRLNADGSLYVSK